MLIEDIGINDSHGKEFDENRPGGMGFWLLVLVKTHAKFIINDVRTDVKKPSYIILRPDTPVRFGPLRGSMMESWISFSAEKGDVEWMKRAGIAFDRPIPISSMNEVDNLVAVLNYEHYLTDGVHMEIERNLAKVLALMLVRQTKDNDPMSPSDGMNFPKGKFAVLNDLRVRIYAHPEGIGTVDQMAKELDVSRSGLQHMYKKMFGTPISSDVIFSRVNYSKKLLGSTKYPLREVAKRCGYQNEFYFMRQFKEVTGMTPSEYRKKR